MAHRNGNEASMKTTIYGRIGILAAGLCFLLILAAGCLVPEYGAGRDIMVFKVDAGGTEQWQTVIDTGGDDTAKTLVQTADGGYLIGGEVLPWRGDQSYGVFKVASDGAVAWNTVGTGAPVSSVARTASGTIVAVSGSGMLLFDPAGNLLGSDSPAAETDGSLRSVVGTADGGVAAAGTAGGDLLVLKMGRNLTEEWRKTYGTDGQNGAKAIVRTSDGGYLVAGTAEPPGRTDSDAWILRLNAAGDLLWNATLGGPPLYNDVYFMGEAPGGGYSVIYGDAMPENGQYVIRPVEVAFDRDGSVLEETVLNESAPIIATTDGGYVFGTVTYHPASRFLFLPDRVGVPHIVKFDAGGLQEWDTELNATFELIGDAVSVIRTADGGYALLVNRENYPKEPR